MRQIGPRIFRPTICYGEPIDEAVHALQAPTHLPASGGGAYRLGSTMSARPNQLRCDSTNRPPLRPIRSSTSVIARDTRNHHRDAFAGWLVVQTSSSASSALRAPTVRVVATTAATVTATLQHCNTATLQHCNTATARVHTDDATARSTFFRRVRPSPHGHTIDQSTPAARTECARHQADTEGCRPICQLPRQLTRY